MYPMNSKTRVFKNPFSRPWMSGDGAAAAAGPEKPHVPITSGLKGVTAGAITGAIEILITYPTEFVKTQLQLDEKGGTKKYTGVFDCVKKTVQGRGIFGLYRGLSVLLLGSVPKSATRFGVFSQVRVMLLQKDGTLTTGGKLCSGLAAGVCEAIFVVTPMETVKVKFINDMRLPKPRFRGLFHGVRTIVRQEGLGGLYKGMPATVLKQGSNQSIRFYLIESLRDWYKGGDQDVIVPKPLVGLFAGTAGAISVLCNTPVDVVKTRLQGLEAKKYKGTVDCFVQIWKHEGVRAFYKGTVPRLFRTALDVGITFMLFDIFIDVLNRFWK